jgi:glutamine cyclotransferase
LPTHTPSATIPATTTPPATNTPTPTPVTPTAPAVTPVPVYSYRIVAVYPHDPAAWTQGLAFEDGILYEGTGLYGASSLREVELESGVVVRSLSLPDDLFGEGIAVVGDRIVQLTYRANRGLVYDRATFDVIGDFAYPTEGWGLAFDGQSLVMSDGTSWLRFLDPETLQEIRRVEVREGLAPVARLNELEFVEGQLLANVWTTDRIAIIDPATGQIRGWIDLSGLLAEVAADEPVDVLNGIAYDRENGRLFVTGKLWPVLIEIEFVGPNGSTELG